MDNYIVRIYRQEKDKPHNLVGIVEKAGEEGGKSGRRLTARKQAFTSIDELWEILNATRQMPRRKRHDRGAR